MPSRNEGYMGPPVHRRPQHQPSYSEAKALVLTLLTENFITSSGLSAEVLHAFIEFEEGALCGFALHLLQALRFLEEATSSGRQDVDRQLLMQMGRQLLLHAAARP